MKTQAFQNFLGLNNRLPDFELSVRTRQMSGQWLRVADNFEIDNSGKLRRRAATALVQAVAGIHSLHMLTDTTGYAVIAGSIYAITLPSYTQSLFKILTSDAPLNWLENGADLYYSNGTDSGRITAGLWYPLGIATPTSPTLSVIGGSLLPGWYQVSTSYINSVTGEESGVSASGNIELTTTGGIRTTLPDAIPGVTHVAIHLSALNGEIPYRLATVAVGQATYDCISLATGGEVQQRYEDVLPAGTLFMSNGRLCSFTGSTVYIGIPHRPGYYLLAEGYIPFPDTVALVVENQGGTYVCTTAQTFFVPGDFGDVQSALSNPLPYGAVPGTAFKHPTKPLVGWFSNKGAVLADIGGQVDALTDEAIDPVVPVSGISVVLQDSGFRRVVSCGYCVNLENNAATSFLDWGFTSASGGYGTKTDGIYLLKSSGLVDSTAGFGKIDFGAEELKHLPAVYAGVSSESPMLLTVGYTDERGEDKSYTYPTRASSTALKEQRFDTGKGLRSNWFDLTVTNQDGSDFTLASVSFAPTVSTRRI